MERSWNILIFHFSALTHRDRNPYQCPLSVLNVSLVWLIWFQSRWLGTDPALTHGGVDGVNPRWLTGWLIRPKANHSCVSVELCQYFRYGMCFSTITLLYHTHCSTKPEQDLWLYKIYSFIIIISTRKYVMKVWINKIKSLAKQVFEESGKWHFGIPNAIDIVQ